MTYSPGDVTVEQTGSEGCYIAYRKDGSVRIPINVVFPEEETNPHRWVLDLTDSQLEAAIQMCYDDWNFVNGTSGDLLDAAILERERRSSPMSSWAPGIFSD